MASTGERFSNFFLGANVNEVFPQKTLPTIPDFDAASSYQLGSKKVAAILGLGTIKTWGAATVLAQVVLLGTLTTGPEIYHYFDRQVDPVDFVRVTETLGEIVKNSAIVVGAHLAQRLLIR